MSVSPLAPLSPNSPSSPGPAGGPQKAWLLRLKERSTRGCKDLFVALWLVPAKGCPPPTTTHGAFCLLGLEGAGMVWWTECQTKAEESRVQILAGPRKGMKGQHWPSRLEELTFLEIHMRVAISPVWLPCPKHTWGLCLCLVRFAQVDPLATKGRLGPAPQAPHPFSPRGRHPCRLIWSGSRRQRAAREELLDRREDLHNFGQPEVGGDSQQEQHHCPFPVEGLCHPRGGRAEEAKVSGKALLGSPRPAPG